MKKTSSKGNGAAALLRRVVSIASAIAVAPSIAFATPSTTYWAPSTASCQGKYIPHITYDTYYGKGTPIPSGTQGASGITAFPVDTGLTMGILPWEKFQAEVGYDVLLPSSDPVFFFLNGKVCTPESSLFKGSPGISFGIYNVGFHGETDPVPTNFNAIHLMFQKALPTGAYVAAGFYHGMGPDSLYVNSDGKVAKTGVMVGALSPNISVGLKGLQKLNIAADVQTGKNVLGAGGFGLYLYFNDYIDLLVGPVFYFDSKLQPGGAKHLWTTQLDVDLPLGKKTP